MIPHCSYCRFDGQQSWNTTNNRCKGLDSDDPDGSAPQPCRHADEDGTTYRYFLPVDEPCAEDALDRLLPEFDRLRYRLERIESRLRRAARR